MAPPDSVVPEVYPGTPALDTLELHRAGVIPRGLVELAPEPLLAVDAQGVPIAEVQDDGAIFWLGARSARPYERWHLLPDEVDGAVALVDTPDGLEKVPSGTRTILVLASTDGEDSAADLALVRAARRRAEQYGAQLGVVPLGRNAPRRNEQLAHVRSAYGRDHPLRDLTNDHSPAAPEAGLVVLFTGLSGSGKSTVATALHHYLVEETGHAVTLLDGDLVRRHLSEGLGFSVADRDINVRRIGWVAAEIARHGGIAIVSPIAPFASTRGAVRRMVHDRGGRLFLVHVSTPLAECERRDRKGLYARARAGQLSDFTGISSPYEAPDDADLSLDTTGRSVDAARDAVLGGLRQRGLLPADPGGAPLH